MLLFFVVIFFICIPKWRLRVCVCVSKLRNRWGKIADDDDAVAKPMKERDRPGERVREQDRWAWPEFYLVFFLLSALPLALSRSGQSKCPTTQRRTRQMRRKSGQIGQKETHTAVGRASEVAAIGKHRQKTTDDRQV